jgi:GT2 family glycosyltransferase
MDVGLSAIGDTRMAKSRAHHLYGVPLLTKVADSGRPDLLIAAEMMRRVEIPECQDAHDANIRATTLRSVRSPEPQRASHVPVVVAVVSWNTRDLLDRCLRSLKPWADAGTAAVWVADNASSDGSPELVRQRHPWATLLETGENLGFGRAINLVAERTQSRWVAISNSDVALRPGALDRLLDSGEADLGAGVVAPRLILPDGSTQHSAWAFPTIGQSVVQNLGSRIAGRQLADRLCLQGGWRPERARRVPWAVGAFLLIRRTAWDEVGGFDPGQWMSAEDLDLGWRMRAAGWATRYEPRAVVDHEESAATTQVWGSDLALHWQRCAYAWMLRRLGRGRTAAVALINFAGSGSRYVRRLIRARGRRNQSLREFERWVLVHRYGAAPRRILERYR